MLKTYFIIPLTKLIAFILKAATRK